MSYLRTWKNDDAGRGNPDTPKVLEISPKVNKIINVKKTRKIMIELNLTLNTNDAIEGVKGKYYPRVEYKETISLVKLAKHMHQHNTVYSKGVIIGVLSDMVSCIKELCLDGNVVKIDDLGLFKATVEGNGLTLKSGAKISAGVGAQRTDEELLQAVSECTDRFIKEEMGGDFGKTKGFELAVKNLKSSIRSMAVNFREELKSSRFLPVAFEYSLVDGEEKPINYWWGK